jgi:hypothetical protein
VSDAARVRASASERNEQRRRLSEDVPFKTRYCVILNRYCKKIGIVKRQSTIPLFFFLTVFILAPTNWCWCREQRKKRGIGQQKALDGRTKN